MVNDMWADESVFYQFFPLGFCGAPKENGWDEDALKKESDLHRIKHVEHFIPHMKKLGINAIYFSPVFYADEHGYDTRDYKRIDPRLGTNEDFKFLVEKLHAEGIKVVIDGVFNHVGRGFWAFRDVQEKREGSPYRYWFQNISFEGNSSYNDGFWYEGWEGCFNLVKLNLRNGEVVDHLLDAVGYWIDYFDIDGIRLDVAYCLDHDFIRSLRSFTDNKKADFFLLGEMLHGDYNSHLQEGMLHSVTNYECYKGLYSSFNSMNMFEICHSLIRQFGPENWTLYKGKHLLSFVDNHDVSRVSSILNNENHLMPIYGVMFGMPGIPCVYYGSEWGLKGDKSQGDWGLRPYVEEPEWNALTEMICQMAKAKKESRALCYGSFRNVVLTNKQCIFERCTQEERVLVAINADSEAYTAHFDAGCGQAVDLLTGQIHDFGGGSTLPPYSVAFWKMER